MNKLKIAECVHNTNNPTQPFWVISTVQSTYNEIGYNENSVIMKVD